MFSSFRHYPIFELLFSNTPIALIITKNKQLKIYKVKPILGAFFFTREGWFNLDQKYSLQHFKQRVYLYDASNINPIPPMMLKKIEELSKTKDYNQFVSGIHDLKPGLSSESNIDPAALLALRDFSACDPQLLTVGTAHIIANEKLLKKRSKSITATFPIKLIFILIAAIMCIAVFSGDISSAFTEAFDKLGLNLGGELPDPIPDDTPNPIPSEIPDDTPDAIITET